jgi:hypothetical protein
MAQHTFSLPLVFFSLFVPSLTTLFLSWYSRNLAPDFQNKLFHFIISLTTFLLCLQCLMPTFPSHCHLPCISFRTQISLSANLPFSTYFSLYTLPVFYCGYLSHCITLFDNDLHLELCFKLLKESFMLY